MKVAGVALVLCLNIGVDPPDVAKPSPCARKECWIDPYTCPRPKVMNICFVIIWSEISFRPWRI